MKKYVISALLALTASTGVYAQQKGVSSVDPYLAARAQAGGYGAKIEGDLAKSLFGETLPSSTKNTKGSHKSAKANSSRTKSSRGGSSSK